MRETDFLSWLSDQLSDAVSAPVRVRAADGRPVPLVLIREWTTEDQNHHNSAFAGEQLKTDQQQYERYLNFSLGTRVEIAIRHDDDVAASELKESVRRRLKLIGENPLDYHDDLKSVQVTQEGRPTHQFVEPEEFSLVIGVWFYYDHTVTLTESDLDASAIESISENITGTK